MYVCAGLVCAEDQTRRRRRRRRRPTRALAGLLHNQSEPSQSDDLSLWNRRKPEGKKSPSPRGTSLHILRSPPVLIGARFQPHVAVPVSIMPIYLSICLSVYVSICLFVTLALSTYLSSFADACTSGRKVEETADPVCRICTAGSDGRSVFAKTQRKKERKKRLWPVPCTHAEVVSVHRHLSVSLPCIHLCISLCTR